MPVNLGPGETVDFLVERKLRTEALPLGAKWVINGREYSDGAARKIAEICVRTDRPLTDMITSDIMLATLRHLDALTSTVKQLTEIVAGRES